MLAGKGIVRASSDCCFLTSFTLYGKGVIRAGYGNEMHFECRLILEQTLKYKIIIGFYSRNNLSTKVKDGTYVINLDEYADIGTHRIVLFCNSSKIVYVDSFDVEHVPEEMKDFIGIKSIKANIFQVQANNSIMCECFYIGFINFMLTGKKLTDFTSLFSPYDFEKTDNIILNDFKDE